MLAEKFCESFQYAVGAFHVGVVGGIPFTVFVPHHVGHVGKQDVEICIVDFLRESVGLVRKRSNHVGDVFLEGLYILRIVDAAAKTMVQAEFEIRRKGVPVAEDVFHDALVRGCHHCMEIVSITDFIDVRPCREIDVTVLSETYLLAVYYYFYLAFEYDDDKMVFGAPRAGIPDMVASLDFTGEDIIFDISDFLYCLFAEQYCRFKGLCPFFSHF